MARTGNNQVSVLVDTTCGNPRVDEAVKWEQVKDSFKAISQRGQTLVSVWGPKVDGNVRPILGGAIQTRQPDEILTPVFVPYGVHTHEVNFEQPSFQTGGAVSVADQFVLSTRFTLCNRGIIQLYEGTNVSAVSYGKIKISLSNSGGVQTLIEYTTDEYKSLVGLTGVSSQSVATGDIFKEVTLNVVGTLQNSMIPPVGETYDSKLVLEIDGYLDGSIPGNVLPSTPRNGMIYYAAGTLPPYFGVAGATFRLFNPAS